MKWFCEKCSQELSKCKICGERYCKYCEYECCQEDEDSESDMGD